MLEKKTSDYNQCRLKLTENPCKQLLPLESLNDWSLTTRRPDTSNKLHDAASWHKQQVTRRGVLTQATSYTTTTLVNKYTCTTNRHTHQIVATTRLASSGFTPTKSSRLPNELHCIEWMVSTTAAADVTSDSRDSVRWDSDQHCLHGFITGYSVHCRITMPIFVAVSYVHHRQCATCTRTCRSTR